MRVRRVAREGLRELVRVADRLCNGPDVDVLLKVIFQQVLNAPLFITANVLIDKTGVNITVFTSANNQLNDSISIQRERERELSLPSYLSVRLMVCSSNPLKSQLKPTECVLTT